MRRKTNKRPSKGSSKQKHNSPKTSTPPQYKVIADGNYKPGANNNQEGIRLNKYIANAGVCSRRDADVLISDGKISVNGKIVTELGYKVKPTDSVVHNGTKLSKEKYIYVLLNKPKDFISTLDDPHGRKTVMSLIKNACEERIYPVGRLDRATTGLLLFTNDGYLADKLAHPSNRVQKVYQVTLNRPISEEHLETIRAGFELEDGPISIDDIAVLTDDYKTIGIEIHSGRNRIVRRIFEHFDYEVYKLDRTLYAGLTKKDLPRGKWKYLSEFELMKILKKKK